MCLWCLELSAKRSLGHAAGSDLSEQVAPFWSNLFPPQKIYFNLCRLLNKPHQLVTGWTKSYFAISPDKLWSQDNKNAIFISEGYL